MCGVHHEQSSGEHGHEGHRHGGYGRRGGGFRGFGRRGGFPSREVWVERLQAYQQHLERELQNVQDVIERLSSGEGDAPQQTGTV